MNNIIALGGFTPDFAGSPIVTAKMDLTTAKDLKDIQDLVLVIETTGAHKDIKVRFQNSDTIYAEFNMGGNKESSPENETRTQTLTEKIDKVTYHTDGVDFDASNITSIKIQFEDDGNVTGISSADKATVSLAYNSDVANTLETVRGFKSTITRQITNTSSTLYIAQRPVDKNTKQFLTEFGIVVSDNVVVDVIDQQGDKISETYGEWFWVKWESTDPNKGDHRHVIVQRGGAEPSYPPALGNFKKSLQITHEDDSSVIIALDQGYIEEGITAARLLVSDIQQQQDDFETAETAARTAFQTAQETRQSTFETGETAARTAFEAAQTQRQTDFENDNTNIDGEKKKWSHGQFPLSEIDASYQNAISTAKFEFFSGDIIYVVKTQEFKDNVSDGIVKFLDSDGSTVLKTITKSQSTGITTQS